MLRVSSQTFERYERDAHRSIGPRLDAWLAEHALGWSTQPAARRSDEVHAMLDLARQSGMKVERDCAVLAYICVSIGPDWRRVLSEGEVGRMLADPQWEPEAKLLALERALNSGEAAA